MREHDPNVLAALRQLKRALESLAEQCQRTREQNERAFEAISLLHAELRQLGRRLGDPHRGDAPCPP